MLPWSASYVVGSFLAPALARRVQPATVMAGGLVVAAIGFFAVTRVAGLGVEAVIIASTVYSLGLSPVFTLGIDAIVTAVPADRAGAAAALSETGSELGGALGIAVLGSVASAIYRASARHAGLPDVGIAPGGVLLDPAKAAFTHALQVTLIVCAALALATSVVAAVALRRAPDTAPAPRAREVRRRRTTRSLDRSSSRRSVSGETGCA
jgi:DHA2 family multidrug resistance protein-like MFS transporter